MTDQIYTLEQAVLALQNNAEFVVFMEALGAARDSYHKSEVLGMSPTTDPLVIQRRLGHLEGMDTLCDAPLAALRAALKKRTAPPKQQYPGRIEIEPLDDDEDD